MNGKLKAALALVFVIGASLGLYSIVAQKSPAPSVTLTTYQGEKLALDSLRGKVILVNFWATDCSTCVKEMPQIAATHAKFSRSGYETVAIAMHHDNPDYVANFARRNALPFAVAYDADGNAAQAFGGIRATPSTFLIDKRGNIVKRILGAPDFTLLHAQIEALLKESL